MRSSPTTAYTDNILGQVTKWTAFELIEANFIPGWHQVRYNGTIAYVSSTYTEVIQKGQSLATPTPTKVAATPSAAYSKVRVTANAVYIRSTPSMASAANILDAASKGTEFELLQANVSSGWHKISYKGKIAYVGSVHVKIV